MLGRRLIQSDPAFCQSCIYGVFCTASTPYTIVVCRDNEVNEKWPFASELSHLYILVIFCGRAKSVNLEYQRFYEYIHMHMYILSSNRM